MTSTGYIQVHAYTSNAQIPLRNVSVIVSAPDNTALAMRLTDRSGLIDTIEIPVPPLDDSQSPSDAGSPYTTVNLQAFLRGYVPISIIGLQVFADTVTFQDLEMVPQSDNTPDSSDENEFVTPDQGL